MQAGEIFGWNQGRIPVLPHPRCTDIQRHSKLRNRETELAEALYGMFKNSLVTSP